jgi:GNAT superfamily N-acetyltransferase
MLKTATTRKKRRAKRAPVEIRRAAAGEHYYHWSGYLYEHDGQEMPAVWNAWKDGELVGSIVATVHEDNYGEYDVGNTDIALAVDDQRASSGPYFGSPHYFYEADWLWFDSLYVRRDSRGEGVAAALIAVIEELRMPTFCEFRPQFLHDLFDQRHRSDEEDDFAVEDETADSWIGSAAQTSGYAGDDGADWLEPPFASGPFDLRLRYRPEPRRRQLEPNVEISGGMRDEDEGDREGVVVGFADEPSVFRLGAEERSFVRPRLEVQAERSGIEIEELSLREGREPRAGGQRSYTLRIRGTLTDAQLLYARASYRRSLRLRDGESDWEPGNLSEAFAEIARDVVLGVPVAL